MERGRAEQSARILREPWRRRHEDHRLDAARRLRRDVEQSLRAEAQSNGAHLVDPHRVQDGEHVSGALAEREAAPRVRRAPVAAGVGDDDAVRLGQPVEVEQVPPVSAGAHHPVKEKKRGAAPALLDVEARALHRNRPAQHGVRRRPPRGHELQPVAPRILGEEPRSALDLVVVPRDDSGRAQPDLEDLDGVFVGHPQRRVSLLCRTEILFDPDVDLLGPALEP